MTQPYGGLPMLVQGERKHKEFLSWQQALWWIVFRNLYDNQDRMTDRDVLSWVKLDTAFDLLGASRHKQDMTAEDRELLLLNAHKELEHAVHYEVLEVYGYCDERAGLEIIPTRHRIDISFQNFPNPPEGAGWIKIHFRTEEIFEKWPCRDESSRHKKSNNKPFHAGSRRINVLHQQIGKIIRSLKSATNPKPSAESVWSALKAQQDEIECIQSVECCPKKDEDAIFWISRQGIAQRMLKSRFRTVVSEFNTGKKPLPRSE